MQNPYLSVILTLVSFTSPHSTERHEVFLIRGIVSIAINGSSCHRKKNHQCPWLGSVLVLAFSLQEEEGAIPLAQNWLCVYPLIGATFFLWSFFRTTYSTVCYATIARIFASFSAAAAVFGFANSSRGEAENMNPRRVLVGDLSSSRSVGKIWRSFSVGCTTCTLWINSP